MYRIVAIHPDGSESTIYDPVGAGALPVLGPRTTEELNEAGSLEFSMVYGHPAWERLVPNKTYIKADLDGREIFYGRVLTAEPTVLTGQTQYMCAGALSFLKDGEIAPDPKKKDGTTNFQTMTAEAFFRRCIDAYNADIGSDYRRRFTVGTVNHSRKNETKQFQISQYSDVKSILDNQLTGYFGGFLRVRRDPSMMKKIEAERIQQTYFQLGNTNLLARPQVPGSTMESAGWEDAGDGTATIYSCSYSAGTDGIPWRENIILHVTPIRQNGTVLTPAQLDAYVDVLLSSTSISQILSSDRSKDSLVIWIQNGITNWDAAYERCELYDDLLHRLQAVYYLDDFDSFPTQQELRAFDPGITISTAGGALMIDWVEQYGDTDQGVLQLGRNVISLLNRMTGEELYTTIRPVGDNNLTLSGGQTIDVYPSAEMAEYGKIVKNVSFPGVTTESELRTKAEALVGKIRKTMVISSEISLVDMIFTDEDVHGVNLGDVYTGITGLEGTPMTVAARNRDFENPQNDSCTLKNPKCFEGNDLNTGASGGISKRSSKNSSALGYSYKYIHEFQDRLEINAKELGIYGEQIEIHAQNFVETAQEFSRIATVEGKLREDTDTIMGTGVFQNSEHITEVAGQFRYNKDTHEVELIDGSELKVHKNGVEITVGTRLTELSEKTSTFEGSALWTQRNNITGLVGEFDIVTIDGKRTLRIKSGGGLVIRRNETDFGLWDKGELTGGMMVQMMNDNTVTTKIRGDHIDISTNTAFGTVSTFVAEKTPIIDTMYTKVTAFDGSTLWQQRDNITGVVGEFAVVEYLDPLTGKMVKKLVVKSGGGIVIRRNETDFGLWDKGELTGGMMVQMMNDNTVTTKIRGDHIDISTNSAFGTVSQFVADKRPIIDTMYTKVTAFDGSTLWQQRDNITGVVGEFAVVEYTDPLTGKKVKKLVVKSGGGIRIQRNNTEFGLYDEGNLTGGIMVQKLNDNTVTTTIRGDHVDISSNESFSSVSGTVNDITRSALWQNKNDITGVVGEFEVKTVDGKNVLVIKSGGGIKIRKNNTEFGLYDEDSLTGGIMVEKLNDNTVTTTIRGDHVDITSNTSFSAVSGTVGEITRSALWQDKNTITGVVGEFEVVEYTDSTGKKVKKLVVKSGGGIRIQRDNTEFGLYDEGNLTGGIMVNRINDNKTTVKIKANRVTISGNTTISDCFVVDGYGLHALKDLYATSIEVSGGLKTSIVNFAVTGSDIVYRMNAITVSKMIKSVAKSGSKLTFTMFDDTTLDFSSATSLSGSWSGQIYTVTATTNGRTTSLSTSVGVYANGTAQYSNFAMELRSYDNQGRATVQGKSYIYLIEHVSGAASYVDASNYRTGETGIVARISTTNTYNAGRRAVSLGTMTWDRNSDNLADNNTIRVSTVGKESESSVAKTMYLNVGGWLWGNAIISVVENTRDGRGVMVSSISIPEVTDTVWENTPGTRKWRAGVIVGGITRYSEEKDFSDYYYVSKDDIQFYRDRSVSTPDQIPGWGTADAPVQVESNFGLPKKQYGWYYFHITVHGRTKYYYFYFDTR